MVKFYNSDGVVQTVTFAYLIDWWVSCSQWRSNWSAWNFTRRNIHVSN